MSLIQIDHTRSDVFLVDPDKREIVDRAWVTAAIDCYSKACIGLYVSFGAPSSLSTALCLTQAVLPKDAYLRELDIKGSWPMVGVPESILTDNGTDFHANAFKRGCDAYGIILDYRPIAKPHFGGAIEKHIGTLMGRVHVIPGTTFSNSQKKGDYNPEKHACMTLKELEKFLINFVVNVYNQRIHASLLMPPAAKFEIGLGTTSKDEFKQLVRMPPDYEKFLIDFLPVYLRSVKRYGVCSPSKPIGPKYSIE